MNFNPDFISNILKVDWAQIQLLIVDSLRNPSQNPTAFALIIGAATIVLALIIVLVVVVFMSASDDDEDEEEYDEPAPAADELAPEPVVLAADTRTPEQKMWWRVISGAIWAVLIVAVWVVAGYVSRDEVVCTSCHVDATVHAARSGNSLAEKDPHKSVQCVSCHETPNMLLSVTAALPGRTIHIVGGAVYPKVARGYGIPVTNRSCNGCHEAAIAETTVNPVRGLRMSHKEPLASNALCTDCHAKSAEGGVVDRYTVGMNQCIRCHDSEVAAAECSFCHTKDVAAATRTAGTFRARSHVAEMDCGSCHKDQSSCDECHGMRMPHSSVFMGPGHAREAVEDIWFNQGRLCKRCHTDTRRPCSQCHEGRFPGHPTTYMIEGHQSANPRSNGCGGCHDDLSWMTGRNFCGNCHPRYAGVSVTAPPVPRVDRGQGTAPQGDVKPGQLPEYMRPQAE